MQISSTNQINFTQLKMKPHGLLKTPLEFSCQNKIGEKFNSYCANINHAKNDITKDSYQFYLNNNDQSWAYSTFRTNKDSLFCSYMYNKQSIERGKGLGTILHLVNIIEMLENKLKSITLISLADAILFHGKFGFKGDLKTIKQAQYSISSIVPTAFINEHFCDISSKAVKLSINNEKPDYIKKANEILDEFLEICKTQDKETLERIHFREDPNDPDLMYPMKLTKKQIIDNKDHYNALFKKFNIDYHID